MSFEGRRVERPDPSAFLRKREGSPGGLAAGKTHSASPGSPNSPVRIRAGSPTVPRQGGSPSASSAATVDSPHAKLGGSAGKKPANTLFRRMYDRGDLPCAVDQARPGKNGVRWRAPLGEIDLHLYLPVFVEGLQEMHEPYRMLASRGCEELLAASPPERLLPVLPQLDLHYPARTVAARHGRMPLMHKLLLNAACDLQSLKEGSHQPFQDWFSTPHWQVLPLKAAFLSHDPSTILAGLRVLGALVRRCESAGPALVPYYRQLLPPLSRHISDNLSTGNAMHYGQRRYEGSLGDAVLEALQLLERAGGPDAFLNIKYIVPVYESCVTKPHGRH